MQKILIADDHAVVRMGLQLVLTKVAITTEVDEAWDAESVMAKLKEQKYDLILLDIQMPATDPVLLMHWINTTCPATKVLIVSQNPEEIYGRRYLQLGAHGFLRKTSPQPEMIRAITEVLNGNKYISAELSKSIVEAAIGGGVANPFDALSHREFQVAVCLAKNQSMADICSLLQVEYTTINTHKRRLFEKLNIDSKADLTKLAEIYNLLD